MSSYILSEFRFDLWRTFVGSSRNLVASDIIENNIKDKGTESSLPKTFAYFELFLSRLLYIKLALTEEERKKERKKERKERTDQSSLGRSSRSRFLDEASPIPCPGFLSFPLLFVDELIFVRSSGAFRVADSFYCHVLLFIRYQTIDQRARTTRPKVFFYPRSFLSIKV